MDPGTFETSLPVKDIAASMRFYEAVGFKRAGLTFRVPLPQDAEGRAGFKLDDPDGRPLFFIRMPGVKRPVPVGASDSESYAPVFTSPPRGLTKATENAPKVGMSATLEIAPKAFAAGVSFVTRSGRRGAGGVA